MFLTDEEIFNLTGYKQTASQIKWLRQNGFKFLIGGDGKPRIMTSYLESIIGSYNISTPKKRVEPNFKNLEKALNRA
jgi:hypothetical protein